MTTEVQWLGNKGVENVNRLHLCSYDSEMTLFHCSPNHMDYVINTYLQNAITYFLL